MEIAETLISDTEIDSCFVFDWHVFTTSRTFKWTIKCTDHGGINKDIVDIHRTILVEDDRLQK